MEAVGQLDLSGLYAAYRADGQGQAPYDPAVMLGLLFYCYLKGIRSTRKVAAACIDDVGCRVIAGGALPSHQAFAVFFRRHRPQVKAMFVQVLSLCAAEGLVQGHACAVDGSPVSADAALSANADGARLAAQITALEAALAAAAEEFMAGADPPAGLAPGDGDEDQDSDEDGGDDQDSGRWPRRLTAMAARLGRLRAAQQVLAARVAASADGTPAENARSAVTHLEQRLAEASAAQDAKWEAYQAKVAAGTRGKGKPIAPAATAVRVTRIRDALEKARARLEAALDRAAASAVKVNTTDPGSRVLPGKNGGYLQGRNLQLAAVRNQILLAIGLHDNPADVGALIPMIEESVRNCQLTGLEQQIRAWLADSGYASAANFAALDHLLLLVAVSAEAAQTGRTTEAAAAVPAGWKAMASRLATPAGKKLYRRRSRLVEPAFAQFFAMFGRYLNYRGDAAGDEVQFLGAVHNLGKLLGHRRRQLSTT